jgi:hypothetical protein
VVLFTKIFAPFFVGVANAADQSLGGSLNLSQSDLTSTSLHSIDEPGKTNPEDSLNLAPPQTSPAAADASNVVDDSFSALLSRKKSLNAKPSDAKASKDQVRLPKSTAL